MDHSSLHWARQLSATEPSSQAAAATNMAHRLTALEQPRHDSQTQDQAMHQALLTSITLKQEQLQRMVAAQSVAQREIVDLLSSVAPGFQAGSPMDNQIRSGIVGGSFDTKTTFTNPVPQNIATSPGSNAQSHPITSSADILGEWSKNDVQHGMPSGAAAAQTHQHVQSIAFPAARSEMWLTCNTSHDGPSGAAQPQQPLQEAFDPAFPSLAGVAQPQQPGQSVYSTFSSLAAQPQQPSQTLHSTLPPRVAGAAQPHQPGQSVYSTFPSLAAQPQQPLQAFDSAFPALAGAAQPQQQGQSVFSTFPSLRANQNMTHFSTTSVGNFGDMPSALLLRNVSEQRAAFVPNATRLGDGASQQHSSGFGGPLTAAGMLNVQSTFRPPQHPGWLPVLPEGACLDQGAQNPSPFLGAGAFAFASAGNSQQGGTSSATNGAVEAGQGQGSRGRGHCNHGRRRSDCKECKGAGICEHNKRRSLCRECGGSCICEHGRIRYQCKLCGGSQICEHKRRRSHCKECRGSAICEHNRQRHQCKQCIVQEDGC